MCEYGLPVVRLISFESGRDIEEKRNEQGVLVDLEPKDEIVHLTFETTLGKTSIQQIVSLPYDLGGKIISDGLDKLLFLWGRVQEVETNGVPQ